MAIHGITWLYMATHGNTMLWAFTCYFHSSIISYHFIHSLLITHFRSNYYDTYYLRWHRLAAYLPAVFQFHSQFLLTIITHVEGSSRIDYISHSNIRADVETRFPPLFHPDILWAPPPPPEVREVLRYTYFQYYVLYTIKMQNIQAQREKSTRPGSSIDRL